MNDSEVHAYLIPGMGADKRLFDPIELKSVQIHVLEWEYIPGISSLEEYARHLAQKISTTNNIYIGSSMGGMMAVELHAVKPANELVLLSAPASRLEYPPILKAASRLRAGKWFNAKQLKQMNAVADMFMGFSNNNHRAVFYEMLDAYGHDFLKYAVNAILDWDRKERPNAYLQIIGSEDRLFKAHRMKRPVVLEGSGHFLTYEQAKELSRIINEHLEKSLEKSIK
jgi:pimeloyl-ACP methyl ester carboxylesterase